MKVVAIVALVAAVLFAGISVGNAGVKSVGQTTSKIDKALDAAQ